jgi:beta-galactosidase
LTTDRDFIRPDGQDLAYVTVEMVDRQGRRNPVSENKVTFTIDGPGTIIAVGSSNPVSTESFKQPERKAYQGRCLVVVRSGKEPGIIKLKAFSDGLAGSEITISSDIDI